MVLDLHALNKLRLTRDVNIASVALQTCLRAWVEAPPSGLTAPLGSCLPLTRKRPLEHHGRPLSSVP